jgi:hypothetical protein
MRERERERERIEAAPVENMAETWLRWFGHVERKTYRFSSKRRSVEG